MGDRNLVTILILWIVSGAWLEISILNRSYITAALIAAPLIAAAKIMEV